MLTLSLHVGIPVRTGIYLGRKKWVSKHSPFGFVYFKDDSGISTLPDQTQRQSDSKQDITQERNRLHSNLISVILQCYILHLGPLCGDPTGHCWDLFTEISSVGVSLGVSLNKLYDVMEVISVLQALCAGNPQTSVDSPHKWSAVGTFFWC